MNYYRRYVGDYLRDTSRLSMLEHGAYNLLLDYYYAEERPISLDLDEVYRMVRAIAPEERRAVVKVLSIFFRKSDDGHRHGRVEKEIAKGTSAIGQMSDAGRRGAEKRWGKCRGDDAVDDRVGHVVADSGADGVADAGADRGDDATSNLQPPTSNPHPPASKPPTTRKTSSAASRRRANGEPVTLEVWTAYSGAYERRYGVQPLRDGQVNGQLAKVVGRLGKDAPAVAAFYVTHNRGLYVSAKHCVDLLLRDAPGLLTEYQTGRKVTDTEARQADRTQATGNAFSEVLAEAERREIHGTN